MNKIEQDVLNTLKNGFSLTSAEQTILDIYIDKLQKENEKLKQDNYNLDRENQLKFDKIIKENAELKEQRDNAIKLRNELIEEKTMTCISKAKIKEALGNKDIPDGMILFYIETLVSENARLEDIEDRKIQIEYNNVFNKGVKPVEAKIKEALDYIEENSFEDTTGVVLNLQDESYWKLWKILKGDE